MYKRFLGIALILFGLGAVMAAAQVPYLPTYWIIGEVRDSSDGVAKADGKTVVFYDKDKNQLGKAIAVVAGGRFMLNAFEAYELGLRVGETYDVSVEPDQQGYTASAEVTISGLGYDELASPLILAMAAPMVETAPVITRITINGRVYFRQLVEKGQPFITSPTPDIKVEASGREDYGIDTASLVIVKNENAAGSYTYDVSSAQISAQTAASGLVNSLSVDYSIPDANPLSVKKDEDEAVTLTFKLSSAGTRGMPATTQETIALTVMSGPLRLIGQPLVYPAPFSRTKHGECEIQYTLSQDGNVEVYLMSAGAEIIKRWTIFSGQEGGKAGLNKLTWDGRTDIGSYVGNGVYVGTILSKDDNRLLGKFKLSVLD